MCSPCPEGSQVKANNQRAMPNCGDAIANYYKVGNTYEPCPDGKTSDEGATSIDECKSSRGGRGRRRGFTDMENDNQGSQNPSPSPSPSVPGNPSPSPAPSVPGNPSPSPSPSVPVRNPSPSPAPSVPGNPSPSPAPSVPGNPSPPSSPEGNILPTEDDAKTFKEECIDKCIKSKCPDLKTDCTSRHDQTCRESCNQHNGFALEECNEFDCKSTSIKNMIQNKYNEKMALLLGASEVNMNFPKSRIQNTDKDLNCDVEYTYTVYDTDGNSQLSGSNRRNFEFQENDADCTYTLLNMGISQMSEDNMESRIGSTNYVIPSANTIRDEVSSSKTGKTEARTATI